ncbi:single-stranded DNA-binding protein [Streptomyces lydicus]|uniref:single-stranded DNA-binding protein n=1 Tax=Streptomyces lydicus TaxID=47763 RepID=UPI0037BB122B
MAGDTVITVCGNLTADPELRFTPAGAAVCRFTVASTPRTFDKQTNEWKDGESLFLNCSVWRQQAEHAADSLTKGTRVLVQGRLKQRSYETKQGEKRTVLELDVDEVAPSLRNATAKVTKSGGGQGRQQMQQARQVQGAASAEDPWSSTPGQSQGGWGQPSQSYGDEPPF